MSASSSTSATRVRRATPHSVTYRPWARSRHWRTARRGCATPARFASTWRTSIRRPKLGPPVGHADRGRFLQWVTFTNSVIEPAMAERFAKLEPRPTSFGWGSFDLMLTAFRAGAVGGRLDPRETILRRGRPLGDRSVLSEAVRPDRGRPGIGGLRRALPSTSRLAAGAKLRCGVAVCRPGRNSALMPARLISTLGRAQNSNDRLD